MVADRGLGEVEARGQLADADLAALMSPDQGDQPEPNRVGQGLEHLRQPRGRGLAHRLADQRDGAGLDNGLEPGCGDGVQGFPPRLPGHGAILTPVYPGWQAWAEGALTPFH